MRLRTIFLSGIAFAVVLVGGAWLLLRPIPADAVQQKCVKDQRAILAAAYIQLPEGVTWEQYEAAMLAYCDCIGRAAARQLTEEDRVAIVREQITPAIEAKLAAVQKQCQSETP